MSHDVKISLDCYFLTKYICVNLKYEIKRETTEVKGLQRFFYLFLFLFLYGKRLDILLKDIRLTVKYPNTI